MGIAILFCLLYDILTVYFSFEFLLRLSRGILLCIAFPQLVYSASHCVQTRRAMEPAVAIGLDAILLSREAIETAIEPTGRCT